MSSSTALNDRNVEVNTVPEKKWIPLLNDLSNARRKGIILDLTQDGTVDGPLEIEAEQTFDLTVQKTRAHVFLHNRTLRLGAILNGKHCVINLKMTIRTNDPEFKLDPVQLLVDGHPTWKKQKENRNTELLQ